MNPKVCHVCGADRDPADLLTLRRVYELGDGDFWTVETRYCEANWSCRNGAGRVNRRMAQAQGVDTSKVGSGRG